ncbi:MAG TPA: triose-phosphate isomerase [Gemmatimonadaceae bacterium]|nr:triose-phosphate isomerase [Gemmatimonadaceae bacterium]
MRRPIFAANWKMNLGPTEARAFMAAFTAKWAPRSDRTIIFFPPALSLTTVAHALASRSDIALGVQNIWTEDKGAFTGENSAPMAKDAGASYVLVGHSERRHVFGETDEQTAKKCAAAVRHGLTPILCVGELLSEREQGITNDVVVRQLRAGVSELATDAIAAMAIAYEPVWAIGTGKTATPHDANAVHSVIRQAMAEIVGAASNETPVLYGGSVTPGNCSTLLSAEWVDGLLVGGASLDVDAWVTTCRT